MERSGGEKLETFERNTETAQQTDWITEKFATITGRIL
jgi:hypothetical protein